MKEERKIKVVIGDWMIIEVFYNGKFDHAEIWRRMDHGMYSY